MNITINLTISSVDMLEHAINVLKASNLQPAVAVLPQAENVSNMPLQRNKAYLQTLGRQRTPECSGYEVDLRTKFPDVDWSDLEARHKALLTVGYDIFDTQRNLTYGKASTVPDGATVDNIQIDLSNPVE